MSQLNLPKLRFPEFKGGWIAEEVDWFLQKESRPVDVQSGKFYREIGVRSHGKGVFHKTASSGEALGNKRVFWVEPDAFVVNIVFAWEQAVALTSTDEVGFIASHRFPMFIARNDRADTRFVRDFFLRKRGKYLLELASPGGAGRNKTLGQSNFAELPVVWPTLPEQQKIADFLGSVDARVELLRRRCDALIAYKKGMMQRLFSQQIRFTRKYGSPFPDWQEKRLGGLGAFCGGGTPDTANAKHWEGDIPWISSSDISEESIRNINITRRITQSALTASATKIVPPNSILIVSRVGVGKLAVSSTELCTSQDFCNFTPLADSAIFLAYWMAYNQNSLLALCQGTSIKGLTTGDLKGLKIPIPHHEEQQKIADFLSALDDKITAVTRQITAMQAFKKALLQQMFV